MLVFPDATKFFDGTTNVTLVGLKGDPTGVTLIAGPGATASFDDATAGASKSVSFTGYTLGGPNAAQYALATSCCGPVVQKTTATIRPLIFPFGFAANGASGAMFAEMAMPALATFASNQSGVMPTYLSDAGDVFFTMKEEEVQPVAIPFAAPRPYVAPRYTPKAARN